MNMDDPDMLERELTSLKPAQPNDALMQRLRQARQQVRMPKVAPSLGLAERAIGWFAERWWVPVGAAALIGGGLILGLHETSKESLPAQTSAMPAGYLRKTFTPETVDNYLVDAQDLGVFLDEANRPYKLVRATWVDEAKLRGDDGSSRMLVTDAREQFIPVALEIY